MIVVANAGPLIALAIVGHFDLLRSLYGEIHIPPAVRDEVVASGKGRPGERAVQSASWIHTVEVQGATAIQFLRDRLDAGESEAIVPSMQLEADLLLMDEIRGRRVTEARGLNRTGTIGTLIAAKKQSLIPRLTPLLDELIAAGFRMSEDLYRTARSLAGES